MKIRRVDLSPDEWIAGTVMLTAEERGVYITICAMIYSEGGPIIITEEWPRLFGCHGNKLRAVLVRLEKLGKILRNGPEIDQKRCRNELEKARKRSEKALENGRKGGRKPLEKVEENNDINDIEIPDGFRVGKLSRAAARPAINYQLSTINYQPSEEGEEVRARLDQIDDAPELGFSGKAIQLSVAGLAECQAVYGKSDLMTRLRIYDVKFAERVEFPSLGKVLDWLSTDANKPLIGPPSTGIVNGNGHTEPNPFGEKKPSGRSQAEIIAEIETDWGKIPSKYPDYAARDDFSFALLWRDYCERGVWYGEVDPPAPRPKRREGIV